MSQAGTQSIVKSTLKTWTLAWLRTGTSYLRAFSPVVLIATKFTVTNCVRYERV
jgi:hypothetical protein